MKKKNKDQLKEKDKDLNMIITYDYKEDLMSVSDHPDIVDPIIENTLKNIKVAIRDKKNEIQICTISNHNRAISLHRDNFKEALNFIKSKFEGEEDFDKCIEIRNIIDKL